MIQIPCLITPLPCLLKTSIWAARRLSLLHETPHGWGTLHLCKNKSDFFVGTVGQTIKNHQKHFFYLRWTPHLHRAASGVMRFSGSSRSKDSAVRHGEQRRRWGRSPGKQEKSAGSVWKIHGKSCEWWEIDGKIRKTRVWCGWWWLPADCESTDWEDVLLIGVEWTPDIIFSATEIFQEKLWANSQHD